MVQCYYIFIYGFLVFIIDSKVGALIPNVYANYYLNKSSSTQQPLLPNVELKKYKINNSTRPIYIIDKNSNKLMKRYYEQHNLLDQLHLRKLSYYNYYNTSVSSTNNITEESKKINPPHLFDILKTNLSKIIKNVISNSPNYTKWINKTYYPAFESLKLNKNVFYMNNTLHNKTLPSLLRTFRNANSNNRSSSVKHTRSPHRNQRNGERSRHRHSKRVYLKGPVDFLLPPTVTDYPELSSLEIEPLQKANEQFKKLLKNDDIQPNSLPFNEEKQLGNQYISFNDATFETRQENTVINQNYTTPARNNSTRTHKKRRKLKQSVQPSHILRPPTITFTTTDHIFYVTPKFKSEKIQEASENLPVVTTPSYIGQSLTDNNIFYDTTQKTIIFDDNDTNVYTNNYETTNNTNWFIPQYSNYDYTNVNNTTDFDRSISESLINENTFGLKNLSLYYSINDNNTKIYKNNNYYLPNTTYRNDLITSTTQATINYDLIFPEYQPIQNVPIQEINYMTSANNAYGQDSTYNNVVQTPAPLLSPDVEKAGMKVYHWSDFGGQNYTTPIFWQNASFASVNDNYVLLNASEFDGSVQNAYTQPLDEENNLKHENIFDNSRQNRSSDVNLAAAETMYYKKPALYTKPSQYILQQAYIDHRQVIPGHAGEDYPTLSKPPISSRFSCKNDGRRYVADVSTGCQVFIMCVGDGPGEPMLCPNGTLFSQEYLVCDWWYNVDCHS